MATLAPKHAGKMGAPNLKLYYLASVLDQNRYWWSTIPQKSWTLLEVDPLPLHKPQTYSYNGASHYTVSVPLHPDYNVSLAIH